MVVWVKLEAEFGGEGGELFVVDVWVWLRVFEIGVDTDGDEVDVGVGHKEAFDEDADAFAVELGFEVLGDFSGGGPESLVIFVGEIPEVVDLEAGDDESVAVGEGANVEEGEGFFVFVDFMRREVAVDDFGED